MRKKEDIDKQLKYVASPRAVISFKQSKKASRKIINANDEETQESQ
jgi:hypothetical protein